MIGLAMLMAVAATYPGFDQKGVAIVCRLQSERISKAYPDSKYTAETCMKMQQSYYRRFLMIAQNADEPIRRSIASCVAKSGSDGGPDWTMIKLCAIDMVDGQRDFPILRKSADGEVRAAVDKCLRDDTKDNVIDWDGAASCARDQISGERDFKRFLAAAGNKADRARIAQCRTEWTDEDDKIVDWDMAVDCAAGGSDDEPSEPAIVIR